ncbi:hypothetical protein [Methylobacterium oryzisoli]|uniref:hypothetical protein n=1 Tax=Methylobacterium oryzisoli TaxID=3385502 RepID=UPI003891FB05
MTRTALTERRRRRLAPLVGLGLLMTGWPGLGLAGPGGDGLGPIVARAGSGGACFERVYDAAHLARQRGQTIAAMTVLLTPDPTPEPEVRAFHVLTRITLRSAEPLYGQSTCWWEAGANLGNRRERLVAFVRDDDATRCMAMIEPDNAEEAGDYLIAPDPAGRILMVQNGFSQMRAGPAGARAMRDVAFGAADATLKLHRVDPARCTGLAAVLAEPVRVQNR